MKQRNNPIVYFFLLIITTSFLPLINGYGISSLKQNFNINPEDISIDYNFDKIDDRILPELKLFGSKSIDVIVKFDRRINSFDRIRLANIGATSLSSSWNLERCIKITINSRLLKVITNFPGVEFISKAEKRAIMVAIEGNNFEDLNRLKNYPQTEIYWNVGCALVPFYSGIENDLNLLGSFSYIQDITDSYLETTIIPIDNNDLTISTVKNAETINATSLWDLGYNGSGVKIGNIDTGINSAHLDFAGRIMAAQSFILTNYGYEYNDTTTSDPNGHGSHTTGIMAGNGTGNIAYKGIAPESEIYFAKIGNPATLYSVVVALDWLVTQGVETINFSYGGSDSTGLDIAETAMRNVVRNNGILLSLSAGNDGDDGFYTVGTPGTTDDVITVGNVNDWNNPPLIVSSSARGPTADDHMKPDLMAPGYGIYSCGPTGTVSYVVKSGTSMAAPQVTGSIALLIQACKNNGIDYNPGLLKGALMKTATLKTPISSYNLLVQGRGIVNVGAAWNLIVNSAKEDLMPIIGACNPVQQPLHYWSTLLQGQVSEQYLTCVSPFKSDLSIEVSGDISSFITIDPIPEEYTSIVKIKYSIPINATIGSYSGQINFKYKTNTLDSISLILSVAESNGHRMLLNYRTTDFSIDHMYGQYIEFTQDILNNQFVLSEQNTILTEEILANYEAIWLPDPFNYQYPLAEYGDFSVNTTNPNWATGEISALTNYVNNGGTVFLCFLGQVWNYDELLITNTNVTAVNEFTEQFGIHVRDTILYSSTPSYVNTIIDHPLTVGVERLIHAGCSLELSGDAVQLTELSPGSPYATCAYTQTDAGGRVIVLTTNYVLDAQGYQNEYLTGESQNDIFGRNLIRWATAKNRITRLNYTEEEGIITLNYRYLNGESPNFGGYVITPSEQKINLTWIEVDTDIWQSVYYFSEIGTHLFYPECGISGIGDYDYFTFESDQIATTIPSLTPTPSPTPTQTPTSPTETVAIIFVAFTIVGIIGLTIAVIIKKRIKQ